MSKRTALPPAAMILRLADAQGRLAVRATPNAGADAIALPTLDGPEDKAVVLAIRVTATPENGKANDAVIKLLAKALGCPKSRLSIVRGETARDKLIAIQNPPCQQTR